MSWRGADWFEGNERFEIWLQVRLSERAEMALRWKLEPSKTLPRDLDPTERNNQPIVVNNKNRPDPFTLLYGSALAQGQFKSIS